MAIRANESKTIHIDAGQVLTLDGATNGGVGSAVRLSDIPGGEPSAPVAISSNNKVFGPYTSGARVLINCTAGSIAESVGKYDVKSGSSLGDNAAAGQVGEILTASVASGSAVSLSTATAKDVISLSLTPGDWDVTGVVAFTPGATTSITQLVGSVSNTQDTIGTFDQIAQKSMAAQVPGANDIIAPVPVTRFNLSATTTIHLVAKGTFTVSTLKAYGYVRARRVR